MGSTTAYDPSGDTTIAWTPDRNDEMASIIAKKMTEGLTFFIVDAEGARAELEIATAEALKLQLKDNRRVAIRDEDFSKFVQSGQGVVMKTPTTRRTGARRSSNPKEVAAGHSVGVRRLGGG